MWASTSHQVNIEPADKKQEKFHREKDAVYEMGLQSSPWQQTDDTLTRVDGQNQHCHIVCNPVYTSYHTRARKDRLSVLDVLRNGRKRLLRIPVKESTDSEK